MIKMMRNILVVFMCLIFSIGVVYVNIINQGIVFEKRHETYITIDGTYNTNFVLVVKGTNFLKKETICGFNVNENVYSNATIGVYFNIRNIKNDN